MEEWKQVKDYEGYYISNFGRVISDGGSRRFIPKILKQTLNKKTGYFYVTLCKNAILQTFSIHRLVGEHFISNPQKLPTIDHINRQKKDNIWINLRWANMSIQNTNKNKKTNFFKNNKLNELYISQTNYGTYRLQITDKNIQYRKVFKTLKEAKNKRKELCGV